MSQCHMGQSGSLKSDLGYLREGPSLASSQRPLSDTLGHWDRESSLRPGQYTAMLRTPASENIEDSDESGNAKPSDNNESDSFVSVRLAEARQ